MTIQPQQSRPTLEDVARAAKVSSMTVSRVVRGTRVVKAATVARVQEVIARLGYQPDPSLCALAAYRSNRSQSGRGHTLVFLDCDGSRYSEVVLAGAREEATLLGYTIESFRLPTESAARRRLGRTLFHRGVRGILVGPSDVALTFEGWNWPEFVAVSMGALVHEPAMHAVAMDYFQGAMDACEQLKRQGCRRIAMAVEGHLETRTGHRWMGGYSAWLALAKQDPLVTDPHLPAAKLKRWAQSNRVDGVITIHSAVHETLQKIGVAVFYLNDFECPPGVPHLALDARKIGAESVRVAHPLLLRREFGTPENPKMLALHATPFTGVPGIF